MIDKVLKQFGRHIDILILFIASVFVLGGLYASNAKDMEAMAKDISNANSRLTLHDNELGDLRRDTQIIRETVARIDERTISILKNSRRND